jgi:hypothetical protein
VYSADYTGYANIDSGVKGTVAAHYYFSGEQDTVRLPPPYPRNIKNERALLTHHLGLDKPDAAGPLQRQVRQTGRRRCERVEPVRAAVAPECECRGVAHAAGRVRERAAGGEQGDGAVFKPVVYPVEAVLDRGREVSWWSCVVGKDR